MLLASTEFPVEYIRRTRSATYFWKGIPRRFRERLEHRLMSQSPTHDISTPFSKDAVEKVAKTLLQRDRFDSERLPSEDSDDSDDSDSSSDSDSESDSESSDDEDKKTSKKHRSSSKKTKSKKKKLRFAEETEEISDNDDSEKETHELRHRLKKARKSSSSPPTPATTITDDEKAVEQLIEQLNRMSVNDPSYAALYFRACKRDPLVQSIVRSPASAYDPPRPTSAPRSYSRDPPPHADGRASPNPRLNNDGRCFGCGEFGHGMSACTRMQDLERQHVIARDSRGRYIMANGARIQRERENEPLATAALRQQPAHANYIAYATIESETDEGDYNQIYPCRIAYGSAVIEEITSDEDEEYLTCNYGSSYSDSDSDAEAYPVHRTEKEGKTVRRQQFAGVWPPARPARDRKINKPAYTPTVLPRTSVPGPSTPTAQGSRRLSFLKPQTPIDVRPAPYRDPEDSDIFMEDNFEQPKAKPKPKPAVVEEPKKKSTKPSQEVVQVADKENVEHRQARASELQTQIDMQDVLNKVLKAPITLQVGELLGVSKEAAHHVSELLRPRTIARIPGKPQQGTKSPSAVVAATLVPKARGTLIRISVECDNKKLQAIVDTGSQLNIINRNLWKATLGRTRPTDITKQIGMTDANGGATTLTGFVPNVPLACGEVLTHASIFVGENAPFDLLLGRPWQRGNFVTIDERLDGTYLLFKNRAMDVKYEIFVTPDMSATYDPEIAQYLAQTGALTNYMVTVDENEDFDITSSDNKDPASGQSSPSSNFDIDDLVTAYSDLSDEDELDIHEVDRRLGHLYDEHGYTTSSDESETSDNGHRGRSRSPDVKKIMSSSAGLELPFAPVPA